MGSGAALNATQMRVAALIQKSSVTAMEEPHDRKHLLICLLTPRSPAYDVGKNQKIRARKNLAHFFRQDGLLDRMLETVLLLLIASRALKLNIYQTIDKAEP